MMVDHVDDIVIASHKTTQLEHKKAPLRTPSDKVFLSGQGVGGDQVKRIGKPLIYSSDATVSESKVNVTPEGMGRYRQMVMNARDLTSEERASLRDDGLSSEEAGYRELWRIVTSP